MKTQLLEDIGENAALSLTPSNITGIPTPGQAAPALAPAAKAQPARPRSALGVWRQKPAAEPPVSTPQQPERQPTPEELDKVLEEIAALEAQYVPPRPQPEPVIVPAEPRRALPVRPVEPALALPTPPAGPQQKLPTTPAEPQQKLPTPPAELRQKLSTPPAEPQQKLPTPPAQPQQKLPTPPAEPQQKLSTPPAERQHQRPAPPVEPPHQPAVRPAEPALAAKPAQAAPAPQVPLFDFTPPSPARQDADPFTPASTPGTRSRQRYLLWGACVLSGALLILGGRWLYQERSDAGSLALIAGEAQGELKADNALMRPATAAKEATQGPGSEARVPPAEPASPPVAALPPLVMLEPDSPAAAGVEAPAPSAADREALQAATSPEPVAAQKPASPAAKAPDRIARARSEAAAERAAERRKREPVRQLARASNTRTEKPAAEESTMEATLRACRAHGYHAAQCIKRDCSVTKHGFVCRGR